MLNSCLNKGLQNLLQPPLLLSHPQLLRLIRTNIESYQRSSLFYSGVSDEEKRGKNIETCPATGLGDGTIPVEPVGVPT